MANSLEEKLEQFLNLYWLRPENGLLTTFKSKSFEDIKFTSPSLDLSCGDGMFMYIHLGGKFSDDFDYFLSTKAKDFSHNSFVDIFDTCNDNYSVNITKQPKFKIDYGTDWKESLLTKASKLNLYNNLILHDNNSPLPFPDNYFQTIHSNSIYWIKNVDHLLSEIHRVLHPDGVAILHVMTQHHLATLTKLEEFLTKEAIDILDRKRRETLSGLHKYDEWLSLISSTGFKINEVRSVYPNELILDLWNIGLRPISHLLIQMSDSLTKNKRTKIKNEWVDIFFKLFKSMLYMNNSYRLEQNPYLLFILNK